MKLRIRGNSIRLRLQRNEVEQLEAGGRVVETLALGSEPEAVFSYQVDTVPGAQPGLSRSGFGMCVTIPVVWAEELVRTDRTGFHFSVEVTPGTHVRVTLEKDFQCLVERLGEDDTDAYEHPHAGGGHPPKCGAS